MIENPRDSFLWKLPGIQRLGEMQALHEIEFDMCCYGAARSRHHLAVTTLAEFNSVAAKCRHLHAADEWRTVRDSVSGLYKYPLALEYEYTAQYAY